MTVEVRTSNIVIFELEKCSIEKILNLHPKTEVINWCNGYIFFAHSVEPDIFHRELIDNGVQYFDHIFYCECPKIPEKLTNAYAMELHIMNNSDSVVLNEVIQYIKEKESHEN